MDTEAERLRERNRHSNIFFPHHEFTRWNHNELHADGVRRLDRFAKVIRPRFLVSLRLCFVAWRDESGVIIVYIPSQAI